jgi:hypothetical protein
VEAGHRFGRAWGSLAGGLSSGSEQILDQIQGLCRVFRHYCHRPIDETILGTLDDGRLLRSTDFGQRSCHVVQVLRGDR